MPNSVASPTAGIVGIGCGLGALATGGTALIVVLYCLVLVAVGNLFAAVSSTGQRSLSLDTKTWLVTTLALSTAAIVLQTVL